MWQHYQTLALIPLAFVGYRLVGLGLPRGKTVVAALVVGLLFLSTRQWLFLGAWLAGQPATSDLPSTLPFAPALLSMMPSLGILGLALLVAKLGSRSAVGTSA